MSEPFTEAGAFPIDCLPHTMRLVVEEVARVTTSRNVPLAAASALGTVAAACGAGIEIASGPNRSTRSNLFILGVAESGTGKSENFRLVAEPLNEIQKAASERFRDVTAGEIDTDLAVAEERRKSALRQAARCDDPNERTMHMAEAKEADARKRELERLREAEPTYLVGDITREALAALTSHQNRESIASFSAEARGIVSVITGRYSNASDEDVYCASYSGDMLSVHRMGRDAIVLKRPCLTVCWFIQPDVAATLQENTAVTDSGLLPRFLLFNSDAEPREEAGPVDPIPGHILRGWSAFIGNLVELYRDRDPEEEEHVVTAADDAGRILRDYANKAVRLRRTGGQHRDLASYLARWGENAWRLALVLHVAKHGAKAPEHQLACETAESAVTLMDWFTGQQLRVLRESRHEKLRKRFDKLRAILIDRGGECSARDLDKSHGFDLEELNRLASHFDGKIEIEKHQPAGGGRPSIRVSLTETQRAKKTHASTIRY